MKSMTAFAVAAASISIAANTQIVKAQTERDLESHEHGSAALNVAVDNGAVFIELDTPWNNLVGFEHAPRTEEQESMVEDALALLNQPEQLFAFTGTDCVAGEAELENNLASGDEDAHHDEHDDDHKDEHAEHDDDHKDEHAEHDDHKDEHDDEHAEHEGETHSSVLASYSFTCENSDRLSSIEVKMLDIWSGFEDLDVQLIGPGGQALVELGQQNTGLDIRQVQ